MADDAPHTDRRSLERSVWPPDQQHHAIGSPGAYDPLRGPSWAASRTDGAGTLLATAPMRVPAGHHAFLLPLLHHSRAGVTLGSAEVSVDGRTLVREPIVSRRLRHAWQREIVTFDLDHEAPVSLRVNAAGGHRLWTASVTLFCEPPRPFHAIMHMHNTPELAERALAQGANAVECDVRVERREGRLEFFAWHGFVLPYPRRSTTRMPLGDYLVALRSLADRWALLVLDCKPAGDEHFDYRDYGRRLAELVGAVLPPDRILVSLHDESMVDAFLGCADAGFRAGRDINIIDNTARFEEPEKWIRRAEHHRLTALGIGTDAFVIGNVLKNWFAPMAAAVNGRDHHLIVKKVYYWTLQAKGAIRKMLDHGVDGLMVNHPGNLREALATPPFDQLYRLATPRDSQFVVHALERSDDVSALRGATPRA